MPHYLSLPEAADYLGIKIDYLRRQLGKGLGPTCVRPSPKVALFTEADLEDWRASWITKPAKNRTAGV